MEYSATAVSLVILAMLLSSFAQGAIGFASALIALPLMLSAGLDLPVAVATTLISSTVQNGTGIYRHRRDIHWRDTWLPALLRLASLPCGAVLMFWMDSQFSDQKLLVRQSMGGVLLLILIGQLLFRVQPRSSFHPAWQFPAFGASGFLQGSFGLPGPPMVLWIVAHDWEPARARGFLFLMFAVCLPLHVILYLAVWPEALLQGLLFALLCLPATAIGTYLGLRFGDRIGRELLRRITFGVLFVMTLNLLLSPFIFKS